MSMIAIFGAAAFWEISQQNADKVLEQIIEAGVNHIDVAPSYGQAEERIGPWMPRERNRFFLGCKTTERTKDGAWSELQRSLKRLQTETFDLYQLHAITTIEARERGLTRFIGITGHGADAPQIYLEALRRFDFDSVLFPLNFVQMANPEYRKYAEELIATCNAKDVGTMIIKAITKAPWGERPHTATTWYEPFDKMDEIQRALNFALSYDVTGFCTAGDTKILPMVLEACENFKRLNTAELEEVIRSGKEYEPLFS
jgi:predicted aldo/keto reductase-like oxidoreductase